MNAPLVLDFDGAVATLPGERRIDLGGWQEAIRFGSSLRRFRALRDELQARMPQQHGTVFLGSGDFHHLTWPLVERVARSAPFEVVVFDNHPDNMRFPFGVHCGSWVRRVARLRQVTRVHVLGITSGDVALGHAWENHLAPLVRGRLCYWTIGVDTGWARRIGLARAFRAFDSADALLDRFIDERRQHAPRTYLSIDKDVLAPDVARTNWDQGCLGEAHLAAAIAALAGCLVGSDITGDVSAYRYRSWWKRRLSALDAQPLIDEAELAAWQRQQHALNLRLLGHLAMAGAA